jgi:hypothetical protein
MQFAYDPVDDVLTIEGIRYSGDLFRYFALETPPGRWIRILKREDGRITLEQKVDQ